MRIQIVIVNYRTPELALDCLQSLVRESIVGDGVRVSLVDGNSGDDSIPLLRQAIDDRGWSDWIDWLPLSVNGGFAYGNNAAIRAALASRTPPDFVWLLNPDTVVRTDALKHLLRFLTSYPEVGIVGSRLEDRDGTPQRSAFRFPTWLSEIDSGLRFGPVSRILNRYVVAPPVSDQPSVAGWVAGASMLIRREVFDSIGLLDEEYFMYFEEVDFCKQAARAGWKCGYEPSSRVVHLVGRASGVTGQQAVRKRRPKYWFDSRRRYFVKNHGVLPAMAADLLWVICYSLWCVRAWLQGKQSNDPPKYLLDFLRNSVFMRGFST